MLSEERASSPEERATRLVPDGADLSRIIAWCSSLLLRIISMVNALSGMVLPHSAQCQRALVNATGGCSFRDNLLRAREFGQRAVLSEERPRDAARLRLVLEKRR